LQQRLPSLMQQFHVPGVSFALIDDRQLVWSRGFGVRCAGSSDIVEPDTIMEACSMSKPFFAYLLLQQVQQQRFDLDQPLLEYLASDSVDDDPRHHKITARMALSHTTGLPNWRSGGWRSGSPLSLAFEPGSKFHYSGEGYLMLQRALERALDTDLDTLSRQQLIEPLALRNTGYVWNDRFVLRSACGHDRQGRVKPSRKYYDRANAAYTLYTSAEDYARFLVEMLREDRSAEQSISAEMQTQMLTVHSHRDDKDVDWGLGWGITMLDDRRKVFHSGANGSGFRCYSEFFPETGDGLVIMTNALAGDDLWKSVVDRWHTTETSQRVEALK
jgi:CubicO group peptidase (beta-lactamase class C family)